MTPVRTRGALRFVCALATTVFVAGVGPALPLHHAAVHGGPPTAHHGHGEPRSGHGDHRPTDRTPGGTCPCIGACHAGSAVPHAPAAANLPLHPSAVAARVSGPAPIPFAASPIPYLLPYPNPPPILS